MKFISFSLENFKGVVQEVTVELTDNGKPLVIVGNNECGKTTILKGIELIGKLCKGFSPDANDHKQQISACKPRIRMFNGKTVLTAVIDFEDDFAGLEQHLADQIKKNKGRIKIVFVFEFSSLEPNFQKFEKNVWVGENKIDANAIFLDLFKEKCPDIIYYDDFFFDVPEKITFVKDDQKPSEKINMSWQEILNDILLGSISEEESLPKKNGNTFRHYFVDWPESSAIDIRQNMKSLNDYFTEAVSKDWEDHMGKDSCFKGFEISRDKNPSNPNIIEFSFVANDEKNTFLISERSKGCKWFFCFKILTDIRKYRNKNGIVFLLDEPASNLHVHPQEKILNSLEKLAGSSGVDVVYTTHSPFLIPESDANIVVSKNYANDEKSYPRIECKPYSGDADQVGTSGKPILIKRLIFEGINSLPSLKKVGENTNIFNSIIKTLENLNVL